MAIIRHIPVPLIYTVTVSMDYILKYISSKTLLLPVSYAARIQQNLAILSTRVSKTVHIMSKEILLII